MMATRHRVFDKSDKSSVENNLSGKNKRARQFFNIKSLELIGAKRLKHSSNFDVSLYSLTQEVDLFELVSSIGALDKPEVPAFASVLKRARQRLVLRVAPPTLQRSAVIKCFPLKNPLSMLRWKKYALTEIVNQSLAIKRGLSVPKPYGFAMTSRAGLVRSSAVIMEDLVGWSDIKSIGDDMLAIDPLSEMVRLGIHHLDARDENILISPDLQRFSVIDWQYAAFVHNDKLGLAEHLAAYYIMRSSPEKYIHLTSEWLYCFHGKIAESACISEFLHFRESVLRVLRSRPSLKNRLKRSL